MITISELRKLAKQRKALAKREPRHKVRHLDAANLFLNFAARLGELETANRKAVNGRLVNLLRDPRIWTAGQDRSATRRTKAPLR